MLKSQYCKEKHTFEASKIRTREGKIGSLLGLTAMPAHDH